MAGVEWDADLTTLAMCSKHGKLSLVGGLGMRPGACPLCMNEKLPAPHHPANPNAHSGEIGNRHNPNNLVILTTHASEEARRNYLRMVSLIERERYERDAHAVRSYSYRIP